MPMSGIGPPPRLMTTNKHDVTHSCVLARASIDIIQGKMQREPSKPAIWHKQGKDNIVSKDCWLVHTPLARKLIRSSSGKLRLSLCKHNSLVNTTQRYDNVRVHVQHTHIYNRGTLTLYERVVPGTNTKFTTNIRSQCTRQVVSRIGSSSWRP